MRFKGYGADKSAELFAGVVTFPKGVVTMPEIKESERGGWIYKPEEAFPSSDRDNFGRSEEGVERAATWLRGWINGQFAIKGWEWPTHVDTARKGIDHPNLGYRGYHRYRTESGQSYATYNHPVFGWVGAYLLINGNSSTVTFKGHPLIQWIVEQEVPEDADMSRHLFEWSTVVNGESWSNRNGMGDDAAGLIEEWMKNPFEAVFDTLYIQGGHFDEAARDRLVEQFNPDKFWDWKSMFNEGGSDVEDDNFSYGANDEIFVTSNSETEEFVDKAFVTMFERLSKVLATRGVTITSDTDSYNVGAGEVPMQAIHMEFPAEISDKQNTHGHKVTLHRGGFQIQCGYIAQEENALREEKRRAERTLKEFGVVDSGKDVDDDS